MLLRLDSPKLLGDAISIISEIVTEVKIKLLADGLSITAVDPANVAMIVFRVPKESFSEYEAGAESWGINLEDLKKILKRASSSSSIILEQESSKLKISIFDKVKRNFMLSLIDVSAEEKEEPNLTFSGEVELDSKEFSQSIEDCSVVAESCLFKIKDGLFYVDASGDLNSAKSEFSSEVAMVKGFGRSKYSIEYLSKFIKAKSISDKVVVKFSDDYPLRIDFPGTKMGIGFILAPRVEND